MERRNSSEHNLLHELTDTQKEAKSLLGFKALILTLRLISPLILNLFVLSQMGMITVRNIWRPSLLIDEYIPVAPETRYF